MQSLLRTIIAAACLATVTLSLSACQGTPTGTAIAVATGSIDQATGTLLDEKGYYGLLKGEKILNDAAETAVDMGILRPGSPTAVKIADLLQTYTKVSMAAQKAKGLNDAVGVNAKIREGKELYTSIMGLISGG